MSTELYKQVIEKFKDGFSSQAAKLVIDESRRVAEEEQTAERLERSDQLARLGVRLHLWGDDPARQKYRRELAAYKKAEEQIDGVFQQLADLLNRYVTILRRLPPLVEEKFVLPRLTSSPFERLVLGNRPVPEAESQEYLLGNAHGDMLKFVQYAYSFSNGMAVAFLRRSIKPGMYHAYAEIILDLANVNADLKKIETLQKRISGLIERQRPRPCWSPLTEQESRIWTHIAEVLDPASISDRFASRAAMLSGQGVPG